MESKLKILLTGPSGFIGTNFILQMYQKYDIVALVRPTSDTSKIESFCAIYIYDIKTQHIYNKSKIDSKNLTDFLISHKIDLILHLGGLNANATQTCNDVKALIDSNITFGTYLLESSKLAHTPYFINAATFGNYCDSISYRPATLYAASKKAFEDIMYYYGLSAKYTTYTSLLIFNVYGPHDTSLRLFNLLDKIASSGECLEMSDGEQIVDYSHVFDVVRGFECLIELAQKDSKFCANKIFALRGDERMKLKDLVHLYEKAIGKKLHIKWGAKPRRELEITLPWEGGELLPNFRFSIPLESGFKMMKDSILTNNNTNNNGGGGGESYLIYLSQKFTLVIIDSITDSIAIKKAG